MYTSEQKSPDSFFRILDSKEAKSYKEWARNNHMPGDEISGLWHPIIRKECELINKEAKSLDKDRSPNNSGLIPEGFWCDSID